MKKLIIFILALVLTGCMGSKDYVVKIGKDKISRGEYLVYLMEQKKNFENQGGSDIWEADFDGVSAEEIAKQNAVNTLVMVKTAVKQTKELGITLTEDDEKKAEAQTEELLNDFKQEDLKNLDLNRDKIYKIMEEVALQNKVYAYVTDSYAINEAEFKEYLTQYYEEHKAEFTSYKIKEIFLQPDIEGTENRDKINSVFNSIKNGTSFDEALSEISPEISSDAVELDSSLYTENTLQQIYSHNKGDCFLVEDTDGYHIFEIADIVNSSIESIEPQIREQYTNDKKQAIYQAQNDSWQGDITVEKNDEVWNNISIVKE
ncbi:MAG: SurA N-terminal domain-containing protein [Clostridia bacterium]|nr:SurA N-terminal domain-containing protein [Clostridia bacterium]